jgi:hypothetical protein
VVNGYDFMIAFTRLNGMRKAKASSDVREKQELFLVHQSEDLERKAAVQERKQDVAPDFTYTEEVRDRAVRKLQNAAFKFDPHTPSCGSPEAFDVNLMKPAVFK